MQEEGAGAVGSPVIMSSSTYLLDTLEGIWRRRLAVCWVAFCGVNSSTNLGGLQFLSIMNITTMNINVQVSLQTYVFVSFAYT